MNPDPDTMIPPPMSETPHSTLLVNARDPEEVRVAQLQDGRLEEIRWARPDHATLVGNLYLGIVRQIESGLDAVFVDFGDRRAGFLHLGNVHPGLAAADADPFAVASSPDSAALAQAGSAVEGEVPSPPDHPPAGIADRLRTGQRILVQVLRDPVRGKGATLSTFLSLPGRLLVLMPSLGRIGVSRRIQDESERQRLRDSVAACCPPEGLGLIARTAAAGCPRRELQRDLEHLQKRWRELGEAAARAEAPGLLLPELSPAVRAVRDLLRPDITEIHVDEEDTATELQEFLAGYLPEPRPRVRLYRRSRPLFEAMDVERDYQLLFRPRIPFGPGGSLVIHETEALTAVDVNSGRIDGGSLEMTAYETNLLAVPEIARQLRLRDLGGIVVVDFIDMVKAEHRKAVESAFRKALRADRARHKLGRLGSFGLLALTRRRQGTGLPRATEAACPACQGSGTQAFHRAGALRALRRLRASTSTRPQRLRVHPGVAAALDRHSEALEKLPFSVQIVPDAQLASGDLVLKTLPVPEDGGLAPRPGSG